MSIQHNCGKVHDGMKAKQERMIWLQRRPNADIQSIRFSVRDGLCGTRTAASKQDMPGRQLQCQYRLTRRAGSRSRTTMVHLPAQRNHFFDQSAFRSGAPEQRVAGGCNLQKRPREHSNSSKTVPGEPVRNSASFENTRSDFVSQSMAVLRVSEYR